MEKLKEYKMLLLSGAAVLLFFVAAAFIVNHTEQKDGKYTYAEHIFQENVVNEINIEIDEADWQNMLENPMAEEYHRADVTINGETVGNVAIRTKGNNTLMSVASSDSDRYSLKIDFDYYDENGNYYGLRKLCLNNNYVDNSSMREYISYKIMEEMGIPVPGCGYSHITVNGEEWGLYLAVEAIDEVFLATHFEDATGDLYKPDGTGSDLVYRSDDISEYTGLNLKTNEETSDGSAIL
ncbi:MAG: CotH kinase family protein, partial [Anaerotignum sp.]|nr:CotH kinase family protein [Anaerotignum sp.]